MSRQLIQTKDNSERCLQEAELCHLETLRKLAEPTIANLSLEEHPNLLIFPQDFDTYGDKVGDAHIFELKGERLLTGNIMGFIGCGNTKVSISSRFAQGNDDYFLHYMLRRVFAINLFELEFNSDEESIFDFLIYLFPAFLKRAFQQGLYREYQTNRLTMICRRQNVVDHARIKNYLKRNDCALVSKIANHEAYGEGRLDVDVLQFIRAIKRSCPVRGITKPSSAYNELPIKEKLCKKS